MTTASPEDKTDDSPASGKANNFITRTQGLVREIVAVALWTFIFTKLFIFDIDEYVVKSVSPSLLWILSYKLLAFLVAVATSWLLLGNNRFFKFIAYVIVYPFIFVLWKIPKLLYLLLRARWPVLLAFAPAIHEFVTTFRTSFIKFAFALLSFTLIAKAQNQHAMAYLLFFLGAHYYRSLARAYTASVFEGLATLVAELRSKFEHSDFAKKTLPSLTAEPTSKEEKELRGQISSLFLCNELLNNISDRLTEVANSRKLDFYAIACVIYTGLVTSGIFAFLYWGLERALPSSFTGTEAPGFWSFLGASVSRLTASGISPIAPLSLAAQLLCYLEVVCQILIVVILAFTFLTVLRERFKEDIDAFIDELHDLTSSIEIGLAKICRIAKDELRTVLSSNNAEALKALRKLGPKNQQPNYIELLRKKRRR
ncbi:MAG: hypothetical protein U1F34_02070 [Gammaproteobacteria bacterium]